MKKRKSMYKNLGIILIAVILSILLVNVVLPLIMTILYHPIGGLGIYSEVFRISYIGNTEFVEFSLTTKLCAIAGLSLGLGFTFFSYSARRSY